MEPKTYNEIDVLIGKTVKNTKLWNDQNITLTFTDDSWITFTAQSTPNLTIALEDKSQ